MDTGSYAVIGAIAAGVIILVVIVLPRLAIRSLPRSIAASIADPKDRLSLENDRLKLRNDFRTTCIQFLAGFGLIAGVLVTFYQTQSSQRALADALDTSRKQLEIAEATADRQEYNDAVKQLSDPAPEIRTAAVIALAEIADKAESRRAAVADILSAFVRQHAPWPPPADGGEPADADLSNVRPLYYRAIDVNAAIYCLGVGTLGSSTYAVLGGDLRVANFANGAYRGAVFRDAYLGGSYFNDADLRNASFVTSDLTAAALGGAKLCGTDLRGATLTGAALQGAVADDQTGWPAGFDAAAVGVVQATDAKECTH